MKTRPPLLIAVCAADIAATRPLDLTLDAIRPQVRDGEGIVIIPNYSAKRRDVERAFSKLLDRLRDEALPRWSRTLPSDRTSESWRVYYGGHPTRPGRAKARSYTEVARLLGISRREAVASVQRMKKYLQTKDGQAFKSSAYFESWKQTGNNAFLA
jgi:hypothetical protein